MDVPVINRIGDFEGGGMINPSVVVARAFAASGIERVYQAYSVWKWGALMVAVLVASFTTIVGRIRVLLIRFRQSYPAATLLVQDESDYDTESESESESGSESESESESEFSDDDELTDEDVEEEVDSDGDEDFSVRGSSKFGRRFRRRSSSIGDFFSWPEFANGTTSSVVKLWDNLGLGMDGSEMLFPGAVVSASAMSPAVIVSAETNMAGNLLRVWDSRVGCRIPQMLAEWRPKLGKIVGVNAAGFLEKVYVKEEDDDVRRGELTVADMRRKSPVVGSVTESEAADTWWDADGVIAGDDDDDSLPSPSKFDSLRRRG